MSGEVLFKVFFILKGIVHLRIRHRTGLKPAVQHFRNTVHRFAALLTRYGNLINKVLVQIFGINTAQFFQLIAASYTEGVSAVGIGTLPNRQRISPVPVPADCPVAGAFKPFPKTSVFDMSGMPIDLAICPQHRVLYLFHRNKPAADGTVNQRA